MNYQQTKALLDTCRANGWLMLYTGHLLVERAHKKLSGTQFSLEWLTPTERPIADLSLQIAQSFDPLTTMPTVAPVPTTGGRGFSEHLPVALTQLRRQHWTRGTDADIEMAVFLTHILEDVVRLPEWYQQRREHRARTAARLMANHPPPRKPQALVIPAQQFPSLAAIFAQYA